MTKSAPRPPDPPRRSHASSRASGDGSRQYDPRKDPKVIGIAVIVFGTLAIALAGVGSTPVVGADDGGSVFSLDDWHDEGVDASITIESSGGE